MICDASWSVPLALWPVIFIASSTSSQVMISNEYLSCGIVSLTVSLVSSGLSKFSRNCGIVCMSPSFYSSIDFLLKECAILVCL